MKVSKLFFAVLRLMRPARWPRRPAQTLRTSQNSLDQVVDRIVTQENADVQKMRAYSSLGGDLYPADAGG